MFYFVSALLCLPAALVATLVLWPFWGRLEAMTGIESLGHSGPATWCYGVVYAVLILLCVMYRRLGRGKGGD